MLGLIGAALKAVVESLTGTEMVDMADESSNNLNEHTVYVPDSWKRNGWNGPEIITVSEYNQNSGTYSDGNTL